MQVRQILKSKAHGGVITVSPSTTVSDAAELLSSKRIGAVIVSEDGHQPVGILSERDIVRELGRSGSGCLSGTVDQLMTKNPITCTLDDLADEILQLMTDKRFRHLPVMDGDGMIGLISIGDVVKARLTELSTENDALQGMIMGY